jgi:hypothetical protein
MHKQAEIAAYVAADQRRSGRLASLREARDLGLGILLPVMIAPVALRGRPRAFSMLSASTSSSPAEPNGI